MDIDSRFHEEYSAPWMSINTNVLHLTRATGPCRCARHHAAISNSGTRKEERDLAKRGLPLQLLKHGVCLLMLLSANHLSQANEISKEQLVQGTLVMADDLISKSIAHLQNCDVQGFKTNDSEGYDRASTLRALDFGRNFIQEVNRTFFPL
ncbi:hypothetical protein AVEN_69082-1, partial [Araneus ventricosus]